MRFDMKTQTAPIDYSQLRPWPLVVIIDDGYIPEFAPYAIEGVQALPEEAFSLLWGFAADSAREEMECN